MLKFWSWLTAVVFPINFDIGADLNFDFNFKFQFHILTYRQDLAHIQAHFGPWDHHTYWMIQIRPQKSRELKIFWTNGFRGVKGTTKHYFHWENNQNS